MDIFHDGILIDVNVSFWSGAKILTAEDLGLKTTEVANAYKLGKKMLIPEAVIRKFRSIESKARRVVEDGSFRFPIGNARFIPKKKFSKVLDYLKGCQKEYQEQVQTLIQNYDRYQSEMIPVYRQAAEVAYLKQTPSLELFSIEGKEKERQEFVNKFLSKLSRHYPPAESLRDRFSLTWDVYEIALPKMKKGDAEQIMDSEFKKDIAITEYRDQTQKKIGGFIDEVVMTLRSETSEICNRVIENIKDGKVVTGRTLQSIRKFIDRFQELNFVGDVRVEEELAKLKKEFLDVHSTEQITEGVDLQDELKRRLGELSESVNNFTDVNSVTGEYRRKISWE